MGGEWTLIFVWIELYDVHDESGDTILFRDL